MLMAFQRSRQQRRHLPADKQHGTNRLPLGSPWSHLFCCHQSRSTATSAHRTRCCSVWNSIWIALTCGVLSGERTTHHTINTCPPPSLSTPVFHLDFAGDDWVKFVSGDVGSSRWRSEADSPTACADAICHPVVNRDG